MLLAPAAAIARPYENGHTATGQRPSPRAFSRVEGSAHGREFNPLVPRTGRTGKAGTVAGARCVSSNCTVGVRDLLERAGLLRQKILAGY